MKLIRLFKTVNYKISSLPQKDSFVSGSDLEEIFIRTKNYTGLLSKIAQDFNENNIDLTYAETKLDDIIKNEQEVSLVLSFRGNRSQPKINDAYNRLQQKYDHVDYVNNVPVVPWFPKNITDIDAMGQVLQVVKDEVNQDHVQFTDPAYRKRRDFIASASQHHRINSEIEVLPYEDKEHETWRKVYSKLQHYHQKISSSRYLKYMNDFQTRFSIENQIPQLRDLDAYLRSQTGFRIKPTSGILSQREFLNALAHKVFFSTQYIRHHSTPEYTPEPDIVHEIIGHIPMFADPEVAAISQQIGLLSLGATDEQVAQLGTLYWYTIEFGACKEGNEMKAYGAGIASSFGECEHFLTGDKKFELLDPFKHSTHPFPVQTVQPLYLYANSFEECLHQLITFGHYMKKPMNCFYDHNKLQVQTDRKVESKFLSEDKGPKF